MRPMPRRIICADGAINGTQNAAFGGRMLSVPTAKSEEDWLLSIGVPVPRFVNQTAAQRHRDR